jgi:hypothetical protein
MWSELTLTTVPVTMVPGRMLVATRLCSNISAKFSVIICLAKLCGNKFFAAVRSALRLKVKKSLH